MTQFDLAVKKVMVSPGSSFIKKNFVELQVSDTEEKILMVFYHIWAWRHIWAYLGHVTWTIYINFLSPFQRRLNIKFGFDWSSGFSGDV